MICCTYDRAAISVVFTAFLLNRIYVFRREMVMMIAWAA